MSAWWLLTLWPTFGLGFWVAGTLMQPAYRKLAFEDLAALPICLVGGPLVILAALD